MSLARQWFLSNYQDRKNKIYTSKYYTPEESWPKTSVWWLQFPDALVGIRANEKNDPPNQRWRGRQH
jgi:hypothetical protein